MAERQFGPYRLVRQIAVGGMAEIHLAKTKGLAGFEKYVAVKMIHPNFAEDEQFIQMLVDEAKIAVQLTHGNIAQTFDLGRVGQTYYITMEYIDGADLYKLLRKGSEVELEMPLDICAFVGKEVAAALDYAHRKKDVGGKPLGIVHRDVSPQNVLVSYAGEVKLVDFGIAKATSKARQTAIGVIKGKYYYMSPEQAWGDPIDYRSDIFSAGIVLYEMITGQMLYLEEDLHKLLDMARKAEIAPPSSLRPGIPPQLERIVMHALAKVPGERYQSAGDLATDLERFLHAYSPVFTAAKLSSVLRNVVGDPMQIPVSEVEPELRDGPLSTQPLPLDAVAHNKEEIRDENSVIFRMSDLDANGNKPRGVKPTPPAGAPRATGAVPAVPKLAPVAAAAPARVASKAPTGKIPSIAKPITAAAGSGPRPASPRPAAPVVAPSSSAAASSEAAAAKPGRPVSRTRKLDEETREMGPAPGDPDNDPSGLLTLEPRGNTGQRPVAQPPASLKAAARAWSDTVDTQNIEPDGGDLENIGERTQITKPGGTQSYMSDSDASEDEVRYDSGPDATMITKAPRGPAAGSAPSDHGLDEDEGPTNPGVVDDADAGDGTDEAALAAAIDAAIRKDRAAPARRPRSSSVAAAVAGDRRPPVPRAQDTTSEDEVDEVDDEAPTLWGKKSEASDDDGATVERDFRAARRPVRTARAAAAAPPALAAKIHSPAVSELRKPRASRRTPPGGVAQANVLQAIVGAQASEPMPTPRPPAPPPPPPSAMLPPEPPEPPTTPQPQLPPSPYATPTPVPAYPPQYPSYPPDAGMAYAPQGYAPPPMYNGYESPPPPYPDPPPAYPSPGALYGYQPFGPPPTPPTLTGQLRLTEGDELPSHLRLGGGKRMAVLALAGLLAVSAAATGTYFLLRATREAAPTIGSIRVDSVPPGAEITLDGQRLSDPTPFVIEGVPVGTKHDIALALPHYVGSTQTVDVPKNGGEASVSAFLQRVKGTLKIVSYPPGAEIRIDNQIRGATPKTITDLDMTAHMKLELRLRDYQVFSKDLAWPDNGEIDIEAKLTK